MHLTIADTPKIRSTQPAAEDPELVAEVLSLKQGEHLCLIYEDDPTEQMAALLPFIGQGLAHGEQCIYIADDQTVDELRTALEEFGIDVASESERKALLLWTREEWRQPGELVSSRKAEQVQGVIDTALAAGFSGIRFAVEMTWTLGPDIDIDRLRHWEATINTIFTPETPGRIICQYSRRRLSPMAIQAALATHPVAILGTRLLPNPYYEAPLVLDDSGSGPVAESARVDWMISQLQWARAYENERAERLRAEAALGVAEVSRRRAEELNRLAQATAEDLRKALTIKDEFLGLVSHELRTPITTIFGNARLLEKHAAAMGEEQRAAAIKDIAEEATRLQRIVENLLILARFDTNAEVETETVFLEDKVAEVVKSFNGRHPKRRVNTVIEPAMPNVSCNPLYLELVLTNLLSNANKYSPDGEPIEVHADFVNEATRIRVLDRGAGILPEEAENLFTPFYRGDRTRNLAPGMGIGLAVCKRLIDAHGCSIWAKPREGCGSEFGFTLPAQR